MFPATSLVTQRWLADVENGIQKFFAGEVHAKVKLCVGSTCVTETELQELLDLRSQPAAAAATRRACPAKPCASYPH